MSATLSSLINGFLWIAKDPVLACALGSMVGFFVLGALIKFSMNYSAQSQARFVAEFEKRVHRYIRGEFAHDKPPPYGRDLLEYILGRTWHEAFLLRRQRHQRRFDRIYDVLDRVFLIDLGAKGFAFTILDYARAWNREIAPDFRPIARIAFQSTAYFNRALWFVSWEAATGFLKWLPQLFSVTGVGFALISIIARVHWFQLPEGAPFEAFRDALNAFVPVLIGCSFIALLGLGLGLLQSFFNKTMPTQAIRDQTIDCLELALKYAWKPELIPHDWNPEKEYQKEKAA